jgi:hypothetical protein
MPKPKVPKRYRLSRSPYWIDPRDAAMRITRMPEPDLAEKIVEVMNIAELAAAAEKFGNEYDGACEVFLKCLSDRTFQRCPQIIRYHVDRAAPAPWC